MIRIIHLTAYDTYQTYIKPNQIIQLFVRVLSGHAGITFISESCAAVHRAG